MAKTHAQQLVTDLINRIGGDITLAAARADALRQLNISSREIMQEQSLRFLLATGTLSVVSSSCAVPSAIDDSKTMTLSRVSLDGELDYVEVDDWYRRNIDVYGQGAAQTEPTLYTIAGATMLFKPAGLTASVPYIAQLLVTALADTTGSFSQLPEGWEDTLLLVDAEAELRRVNNEPGVDTLKARANDKREKLYSAYRTTKQKAWTGREQQERKQEKSQLSDEAAP